jgi:hypothetical protein
MGLVAESIARSLAFSLNSRPIHTEQKTNPLRVGLEAGGSPSALANLSRTKGRMIGEQK